MKSEDGFSLVELVVVMSIVGIASMGLVSFVVDMNKQQARVLSKASVQQLKDEARIIVSTGKNCGLEQLDSKAISVTDTSWSGSSKYNVGKIVSPIFGIEGGRNYDNIIIKSVEITGNFDTATDTVKYAGLETGNLATDKAIAGAIKVSVDFQAKKTGGALKPIYIPVSLALDSSRSKIETCSPLITSTALSDMCAALDGDWDSVSSKCELPCPDGMTREPEENECTLARDDDDDDFLVACEATNFCNSANKYSGANYK